MANTRAILQRHTAALRFSAWIAIMLASYPEMSGCGHQDDKGRVEPDVKRADSRENPKAPSSELDPPSRKADFHLTGEQLSKEVEENGPAAFRKYGGKILDIEGVVTAPVPTRYNSGFSINGIKVTKNDVSVQRIFYATFNATPKEMYLLSGGQRVRVVGELVGDEKYYGLNGCSDLQFLTTNTFLSVTPAIVAADFQKDPEAAKKKYAPATLIMLEATVASVGEKKVGQCLVQFQEKTTPPVACFVSNADKDVKVGERYVFRTHGVGPMPEMDGKIVLQGGEPFQHVGRKD